MSRIWQTGAEYQTISELNDVSGNGAISVSSTYALGGGYRSYRFYQSDASWVQNFGYSPIPGNPTNVYYKADMYLDALTATTDTSSARTFVYPIRFYGSNYIASVGFYNSAGTIHCFVQYGTSSTLTHDVELTGVGLDEWIRVEAHFDSTPSDGAEIFQVKVNDELIVDDDDLTLSGKTVNYMFIHETNNNTGTRTADMYLDNISFNTASGTINNSWIGEEYIVPLFGTGAGDSNPNVGTVSNIFGIPPNSAFNNIAGNYVSNSSNDMFINITDPTTYMGVNDRINAVMVHNMIKNNLANTYNLAIKSASGGTIQYSATESSHTSNVARINPDGITENGMIFISERDPTTDSRWKVTGTNSLTNAQIGQIRGGSTSSLFATAAYSPYSAPTSSGMLIMFW